MSKLRIITSLDLGSSEVSVVVGQKAKTGAIEILGVGKSESYGIKKGIVTDIEHASESIIKAITEAEQMSGTSIREVVLGLNGAFLQSINSYGQVSISSLEDEIDFEDVARAVESSKKLNLQYGNEILHVLPRTFAIDGQIGIRNPIGMSGIKLEVENHVLIGMTPIIKNVHKSLERIGVQSVLDVVSIVANGYYSIPSQNKELGSMIVDIGKDLTSIAIFEEGEIAHTVFIPIGSGFITQDIVIGLKISYNDAEKIKIRYGNADPSTMADDETFSLSEINPYEDRIISKKYLAQIINARVREIFNFVLKAIRNSQKEYILPAGIILTGGGANLINISQIARKVLNSSVTISQAKNLAGLTDQVADPKFSSNLGLINWYFDSITDFANSSVSDIPQNGRISRPKKSSGIIGWIKGFLP
ncbi:MAG: cell division protein FtsA [Patescibacteria group bacterium]